MKKTNKRTSKEYTRIQFDFHNDSVERLDRLVASTDSETRSETIKKALRMYEYVLDRCKDGSEFIIRGSDKTETIIPPFVF